MKEDIIFDMYDSLLNSQDAKLVCGQCREKSNLTDPISIWQLGNEFDNSKYKVLFIGKTARGKPGDLMPSKRFINSANCADELYLNKSWPYWSYTRAICESLYDKNSWEKIAFTNMVKCNVSNTTDLTDDNTKNNCILKNKIVLNEILCIKPLHIVFYTSYDYDNYINEMFKDYSINTTNNTTRYTTIHIGDKELPWWEFNITIKDQTVRCLRTGHPERKKKDEFVNAVANFILSKPA